MPDMRKQVCSSCDTPFMAMPYQRGSLPICGRCNTKMNQLCTMPIKALSADEQRALAQSVVKLAHHVRGYSHA